MNIHVSMGEMNPLPFGKNRFTIPCCICGDLLELPGVYPILMIKHEPKRQIFAGDGEGGVTAVQTGVKMFKPLCRRHLDGMTQAESDALYDLLEGTSFAKEKAAA